MNILRSQFILRYKSGEEVLVNDKVLAYTDKPAIIEAILKPGTALAGDYYVEKEGGILLRFAGGNYEVWMNARDEIELVSRS